MRTLVKMMISRAAFNEIAAQFRKHNYHHVFLRDGSIDMSEIGIAADPNVFMPPGVVEVDPRDISRDRFREIYNLDNLGNDNSEA
ncbi:MAG: hypothetical protein QHD01_05975 [Bradyrhizobium sp.]|uniref:hypothetical protein n=1 Tax=Bradyrhizobium sp. TaxID=376 RepID=UPI0029AAE632|nr:hypothetical protein [Bradyrhizobium sp.]MDX3966133.1 hypothetical protein [Bradyrhizobium sp.]